MTGRVHLGDGAYARSDDYYLWVEADRSCPSCSSLMAHEVALEPSALVALVRFAVQQDPEMGPLLAHAAGGDGR